MRVNGRHRSRVGGVWAPDRNDEYLFYQALVGAWPAEAALAPVPERAPPELVARISAYMQKAVREAKVHTSWIEEDPIRPRGGAVRRTDARRDARRGAFSSSFVPFQRRCAAAGMVQSLAQLVLKLTSPGVADFYQGNELWDLSLVDPDNRRDVDFAHRRALLDDILPLMEAIENGDVGGARLDDLLDHREDGRIKLFVTAVGLRFRRRHADVLLDGSYVPLAATGRGRHHVVAFARRHPAGTLIAAVPRLVATLMENGSQLPLGEAAWTKTRIALPEELAACPLSKPGERRNRGPVAG